MYNIKWDKVDIKKLTGFSVKAILLLFLLIHVYFGVFYIHYDADFMVMLNIISLIVIAVAAVLAHRKRYQLLFNIILIEADFHITVATISFGWYCGFQNYLIALVVLIFFVDYCSKSTGLFYVRAVKLSVICFLSYIAAYIYTIVMTEPYLIDENTARAAQMISSVAVFATVVITLWILIQFTFRIETKMSTQAYNDKLTGLPNRYYFVENFDLLMKECEKEAVFVAIMDIDDFKRINDTYGHNAGDYVLQTVAEIIRAKCDNMVICRWGGEEFLISGEAPGKDEDARKKMYHELNNVRKSIGNYDFEYEGNRFRLTLTMGVSFYGEAETLEDWIESADRKLYSGKMSGKNKMVS